MHATTALSLRAFSQGKAWWVWPAAGWGLGPLMHGLPLAGFDGKLREAAHAKIVAFHRQLLNP